MTGPLMPASIMIKGMGLDIEAPRLRQMGGWVTTFGTLGPDGGVIPTRDREGHTFEAARQLGLIDWTDYLRKGVGSWTHGHGGPRVGIPHSLEFHDGTTALSQMHRKVGFWNRGHLFDRGEPVSWEPVGVQPSDMEFEHADECWNLATGMFKGARALGFSVEGTMRLSPCRSRILAATVKRAALLEYPHNPDATAEAMVKGAAFGFLRRGMVGRRACGACSCPPGGCELVWAGQPPAPQPAPPSLDEMRTHPRFASAVGAFVALGYTPQEATARVAKRVRVLMENRDG